MYKAGMVQRVQNEVKIHCQLKHPSILEVKYNFIKFAKDIEFLYIIIYCALLNFSCITILKIAIMCTWY